jgi:hypothetical protein
MRAGASALGALVISCPTCGAQWELHPSLFLRTIEPDWDAVRARQEDNSAGIATPGEEVTIETPWGVVTVSVAELV